jgi:hypothetical protein
VAEPVATYTVRKGDTLWSLSRAWFPGAVARVRVQRLNRIADVHRVLTGRTLTVPRALLADERSFARVESFSGEVTVQPAGQPFPARVGAMLGEGTVIRTGRGGFVSLRLADQSIVSLPSQSTVRIARLRRVLMTGAVERSFATAGGRVRAIVTPMTDPGSSFEVRTPLTVAAVRGTRFRIGYDAGAGSATAEVEEGAVAVAQGPEGGDLLLTPGFGAQSGAGVAGMAGGPVALLPAPRLADPDKAQTDENLNFTIEPMDGAAAYRIELARDAGMLDLVAEGDSADGTFTLPGLPMGTWFARVSALDRAGLEGVTRTYAFDRVRNSVAGSMASGRSGFERQYRFKWSGTADATPQYRFQLARIGDPAHPVVDEPLGPATELAVTSLPPAEYGWRVLSLVPLGPKMIAAWSNEQTFTVTGRR